MEDERVSEFFGRFDERLNRFEHDLNELGRMVREVSEQVDGLKNEIAHFKGQVKGAYFVFGTSAAVMLAILARTGVLARVFGG